jgi:hypothetical protein
MSIPFFATDLTDPQEAQAAIAVAGLIGDWQLEFNDVALFGIYP